MKTKLLHLAAVLTVAMGASACSSVPDWVDPTTWGGDNPAPAADSGQTPDLADLPDRPTPTSTPDDQKQVSDSLAADRSQTNYSAEQLRGGDQSVAPPPGAQSSADQQTTQTAVQAPPAPAPDSGTSDNSSSAPPADSSGAASPANDNSAAGASPASSNVAPDQTSSAAPPPDTASNAPAPSADTQMATAQPAAPAATYAPPPGAEPAVPMSAPAPTARAPMPMVTAAVSPSDAALGFKASSAPPLDPSVSQFVSAPIIAHYRQTASIAGSAAAGAPVVAMGNVAPPRVASRRSRRGMGGPEVMSGAVVANLDALQSTAPAPVTYSSAAGTPAAVVFFPGDGIALNAQGRAKVREAVAAFQARGGQGYVRVIGHSSSRTANMPVEKHLALIFQLSQRRANAVARELIREGVPASKVLVEAVGDSQPIYYESMPEGEDGNRRAEIFLQG